MLLSSRPPNHNNYIDTHPQLVVGLEMEPKLMHTKRLSMHFGLDRKLHGFMVGCGYHS